MAKWFTGIAGYAVCFNQSNIPESEWFWHCKLADALDKEHAESCTVTQVLAMMERMGI